MLTKCSAPTNTISRNIRSEFVSFRLLWPVKRPVWDSLGFNTEIAANREMYY